MPDKNEVYLDILKNLNDLDGLIREFGGACVDLHEGSEGALIEPTRMINDKFKIIKDALKELAQ